MAEKAQSGKDRKGFSGQFWLVVFFEFIERGSYYGMMSFLSVYFDDVLGFPKENIGVIKGVIQPLLYFLPILSGALADRFGYRKLLFVAFSLLGGGYFLTSQATEYGAVFASLVIMGFGAGIFKPLISGTIAKLTDESNSTLGFGIFYWSINVGAFLFPLILVPFLKAINPSYVIIASAFCTAIMIIPTALFFKDPVNVEKMEKRQKTSLLQTIANAFEIIYSPIVLLYYQIRKSAAWRVIILLVLVALTGYAFSQYFARPQAAGRYATVGIELNESRLLFTVDRDMLGRENFEFSPSVDSTPPSLTLFKPSMIEKFDDELLASVRSFEGYESTDIDDIKKWIEASDSKVTLEFVRDADVPDYAIDEQNAQHYLIRVNYDAFDQNKNSLLQALHMYPVLAGITLANLDDLHRSSNGRAFFLLFVSVLILAGLGIVAYSNRKKETGESKSSTLVFIFTLAAGAVIWFIPGLSTLGRIIASTIYLTATALFSIDSSDPAKFAEHAKFLLMIFIYSGFWILYFQMFDSVLWYVKAYVNADSLNNAVNSFLSLFGLKTNWNFDVEHVTVINAGTIILLQLIVSRLVKKTKALPTMMAGIALGTLGMAILAINTNIWIFMAGIALFSIGEMTAHPKFISYIGLLYKKAMYMGYLFLYGVFGSSIGSIVGAKLYVRYVDDLNQPRTLWLIFAGIGLFTMIALALFNKFLKPKAAGDK